MKMVLSLTLLLALTACSRSDRAGMADVMKNTNPQATKCLSERKQIDVAKQILENEEGLAPGTKVSMEQLQHYLGGSPSCPTGGSLNPGKIGDPVKCSVKGHN